MPASVRAALAATAFLHLSTPAAAQIDARMFRYPDVSADRIAFVYAGDIWVAPKAGGLAQRLSSPPGEELFPRFSPDGSRIAFTGHYDGNADVYVVPTSGGVPTRVTYHPMMDRVVDWDPDGETLLFASSRRSGKQRFNQFYRVSPEGGLAERLPMEFAEYGAISPDGRTIAFMMKARDHRTWKRYRGGTAPDIHTFDLETYASANLTDHPANDGSPMWHGETLYFLSDRGDNQRFNLWARDAGGATRQVTRFDDFDITYPAIGPSDIVFQAGGRLYLFDLATETTREVEIDVVTDLASIKPRVENVSDLIVGDGPTLLGGPESPHYGITPTGRRAVFEARGDIFTVPAEHGPIRNLTASPGVGDRDPSPSPDGRWIAWWSDASGEYELTVGAADGSGEPRTVTSLGPGLRYTPFWSPDSERVAFIDGEGLVRIVDITSGAVTEVTRAPAGSDHPSSADFSASWSPDGRWLAFSLENDPITSVIHLHDRLTGETHPVTSGYYDDRAPVFDPDGRYLYLRTRRALSPIYGDRDGTWIYANTTRIGAVALRDDVASPLAPRSDEETPAVEAGGDAAGDAGAAPVEIDLVDFERRLVVLPVPPGNYADLQAASGKVIYRRLPRTGSDDEDAALVYWDLEKREEITVMDDLDDALLAADGEHLLVRRGPRFGIVSLAPDQSLSTPLRTAELTATVDPRAEWRQLLVDAWRQQRDLFYDPFMHGIDWEAIRDQYLPLIDDAVTRWDVHFVIGEMIAEMNASHTYRGGGDMEEPPGRPVGLLGVDWTLDGGAFRIARIVRGGPWDDEVRSPLDHPGIDVDEGDYVVAVNGVPMDPTVDPSAAFQGLAGEVVALTVSDAPDGAGSREILVETLADETRLRHLEWVEGNRRRVETLSGGRVGYVYVPDTGPGGQTELVRQFKAHRHHEALLIDERFNDGGQIPDRFIELLNRPALAWWVGRTGPGITFPAVSHHGPKAMLMNGWSGSGGDAFPVYFREAGLGPLIGTRTWGGVIGYYPPPGLIDGGLVTIPAVRMYETDGEWFAEGHGVDPDIVVPEDVTALAAGRDPQIERAVDWLLGELEGRPVIAPERPAPEDRSRPGTRRPTATGGGGGPAGDGGAEPRASGGHRSRILDLGGRTTEVVEWGRGEPAIVLVHGASSSPHQFDHFAPRFADDHRLIAYARRGHGKATPPSEPFDVDDLVDDLRGVMDQMRIERAVLVGHSFGGAEITRFAALHPDRVVGLVYLDAHQEMNENTLYAEAMAEPIYPECAMEMASRDDFTACVRDYLLPPLPWSDMLDEVVDDMLIDTAGPPVYRTAAPHIEASMTAIVEGYRREYEKVRAPALFVMSETYLTVRTADVDWNRRYLAWVESSGYRAAQAWWVDHIRDTVPGVRIVTVEGGTHDFIMEFDQTVDEVARFLESIR